MTTTAANQDAAEPRWTPEVARRTADVLERVRRVMPELEWPVHAPYVDAIREWKETRNAVVLAHNYQTPEIFHGVADITGDSLALAQQAAETDADVIVLAGVHFMAETAKILNPGKTVLIPDLEAGCSLAASITAADVRLLRERYPGVPVVTYVNTSAEVKAESDICCTSANAVEVVESLRRAAGDLPARRVPRPLRGLADEGRDRALAGPLRGARALHRRRDRAPSAGSIPECPVLAHPECPPDVLAEADYVGSTAGMIEHVEATRPARVVLVTECSMSDNVAVAVPADVEFVRPCNLCPHMKRITLPKILRALERMEHRVEVEPRRRRARAPRGRADARGRPRSEAMSARLDAVREADVVVLGTGVAGLSVALGLAGRRVDLLTKAPLGRGQQPAGAGRGRGRRRPRRLARAPRRRHARRGGRDRRRRRPWRA